MPYKYKAYSADMKVIDGTIDVNSEELAKERLRQSGYSVVSLKATKPKLTIRQQFPTFFGVKSRDITSFSRQLATLIERGINVFGALQILKEQIRNPVFKEVVGSMITDLEQGSSFADAISRHPEAFPPIYSRMIRVGERTGNLHDVLRQVSSYIEKEKAAVKRVTRALIYPAFIVVVACGVVIILVTVTLPPLLEMFNEFEAELPLITRILIGTVDIVKGYGLYILPLIVAAIVLAIWYKKTPAGRDKFDRFLVKIPLLGPIIVHSEMANFGHTMSLSMDAGLPMIESMELVIQSSRNSYIHRALDDLRIQLLEGRRLYQAMDPNKLFPPLLVQMVKVGEEVGTLSLDLKTVADMYEQEVDERIELLMSLMQPTLIFVLGLIVAFIAISVIMPIYSVMGSI